MSDSQLDIIHEEDRRFKAWGSVECVDLDGQVLPIDEFKKIMPVLIRRGGMLMDQHSNRRCGQILNYEWKTHPVSGTEGVLLECEIFKDWKLDDLVWEQIKNGKRKGLSFGGASNTDPIRVNYKDYDGTKQSEILMDLEGYEFSVVDEPCNPLAGFTAINTVAKGVKPRTDDIVKAYQFLNKPFAGFKDFKDCVSQSQDKNDPEAYCAVIMREVEGKNADNQTKTEGGQMTKKKVKKEDELAPPEMAPAEENVEEVVETLEDRVARIEAQLVELTQTLAPAEMAKVEQEDEEDKEDEEEGVEKQEGVDGGGDIGTTPVNPSNEGGDVLLPESIEEKIEDDEPGTAPDTDEGQIMEKKLTNLTKQVSELQKSIGKVTKSTTPRTKVVTKVETVSPSQQIINKMRAGKKSDMNDIRKMESKRLDAEHEAIMEYTFKGRK